jgi:hypothetical protein
MGISNSHSRHIVVIRNLGTGYVSPQFHVVYDERFGTVLPADGPFDAATWTDLFLNRRDYIPDEDDAPLSWPLNGSPKTKFDVVRELSQQPSYHQGQLIELNKQSVS